MWTARQVQLCFNKLEELEEGDEVIVKDKDGKSLTFEVTGKESYERKTAPANKIFDYSYGRDHVYR